MLRIVKDKKRKAIREVLTRNDKSLELTSGEHAYEKPGRYKIAVKVLDIFGNDTTKVVEVEVKV